MNKKYFIINNKNAPLDNGGYETSDVNKVQFYSSVEYAERFMDAQGLDRCTAVNWPEYTFFLKADYRELDSLQFSQTYGTMSRLEKIELPTFTEVLTLDSSYLIARFVGQDSKAVYQYVLKRSRSNERVVGIYKHEVNGEKERLFKEPLNEENYLKGCAIFKKLFLGEQC